MFRRFNPGNTEKRGSQINEAHQTITFSIHLIVTGSQVLPFFRHIKDERHIEAAIIRPTFAARHT